VNPLTGPAEDSRPTFMAVIGHADEPVMLQRCIEHHLALGVDHVFVSLNLDDTESSDVARSFASSRVRVARREEYTDDPLDYFGGAMRAVSSWAAPDWLMFIDSDEFWVPAGGTMSAVAGLSAHDAFSVRRFNAPPIRSAGGDVKEFDFAHLETALVVGARQTMDPDFLVRNAATPWITAAILPKVMVRMHCAEEIHWGAHSFVPAKPDVRTGVPSDLLIVHIPFSNEARFRRKVRAARAMLEPLQARLTPNQAWHWRRWIELETTGRLGAEFAAQVIPEQEIGELLSRSVLTTPSRLYGSAQLSNA
jgi:hypothetical protein